MPLYKRVKEILLRPATEWTIIRAEEDTAGSIFIKYLVPLILLAAAAAFIGHGYIGYTNFGVKHGGDIPSGVYKAISIGVSYTLGYFITTLLIDRMSKGFQAEKNFSRSAQLVAYSYTPSLLGAIMGIIPAITGLGLLVGLYSIFLVWTGLPVLKQPQEEQRLPYKMAAIFVLMMVHIALTVVVARVLKPILGLSDMGLWGR